MPTERFVIREKTVYEIVDLDPTEDGIELQPHEERIVLIHEHKPHAEEALRAYNAREVPSGD